MQIGKIEKATFRSIEQLKASHLFAFLSTSLSMLNFFVASCRVVASNCASSSSSFNYGGKFIIKGNRLLSIFPNAINTSAWMTIADAAAIINDAIKWKTKKNKFYVQWKMCRFHGGTMQLLYRSKWIGAFW